MKVPMDCFSRIKFSANDDQVLAGTRFSPHEMGRPTLETSGRRALEGLKVLTLQCWFRAWPAMISGCEGEVV